MPDAGLPDEQVREVLALERELQTRACRADRTRVAQLLADDFLEVGASGTVWGRDATLRMLATEDEIVAPIEVHDLTGRLVADDVVIARWDSDRGGRRARRTSLWRHDSAGWRLVHHQGTPLPPATEHTHTTADPSESR